MGNREITRYSEEYTKDLIKLRDDSTCPECGTITSYKIRKGSLTKYRCLECGCNWNVDYGPLKLSRRR